MSRLSPGLHRRRPREGVAFVASLFLACALPRRDQRITRAHLINFGARVCAHTLFGVVGGSRFLAARRARVTQRAAAAGRLCVPGGCVPRPPPPTRRRRKRRGTASERAPHAASVPWTMYIDYLDYFLPFSRDAGII
jgi:hypothetical protein